MSSRDNREKIYVLCIALLFITVGIWDAVTHYSVSIGADPLLVTCLVYVVSLAIIFFFYSTVGITIYIIITILLLNGLVTNWGEPLPYKLFYVLGLACTLFVWKILLTRNWTSETSNWRGNSEVLEWIPTILLILLFVAAIGITIAGFFNNGLRPAARVLCLVLMSISAIIQILVNISNVGSRPEISSIYPSWAITLGEYKAHENHRRRQISGCFIGVIGLIAFVVFLFFGWGIAWWYAPLGIVLSLLAVLLI